MEKNWGDTPSATLIQPVVPIKLLNFPQTFTAYLFKRKQPISRKFERKMLSIVVETKR